MNCETHPERPATYVAKMPSSTSPYTREVPLCDDCGPRIETIGFPVDRIEQEASR